MARLQCSQIRSSQVFTSFILLLYIPGLSSSLSDLGLLKLNKVRRPFEPEPAGPVGNPQHREQSTASGTLNTGKRKAWVKTSSLCAGCKPMDAIDGDPNTVFGNVCPKDTSEMHWITITLERAYKDLRIKIVPSSKNDELSDLLVGVFDPQDKNLDSLCEFRAIQYLCKNNEAKRGIIIYQEACLKFADIKIYTGAVEAREHCQQKDDTNNMKYRGFLSTTMFGNNCDDWKNHKEYYEPPGIAGPYCRTPRKENKYLWCYTGPGTNDWNWCNFPPHCDSKFQISVL